MRLQQLIYFEKIIEKGSINEAAKALYLTQPSLSNALKELENEMKVQLLVRNKQGIIPTAEGREFLIYVRQILDQVNLLEEKFKNEPLRRQNFSVSLGTSCPAHRAPNPPHGRVCAARRTHRICERGQPFSVPFQCPESVFHICPAEMVVLVLSKAL